MRILAPSSVAGNHAELIATASIVFVHGLQGHPYGTWATKEPANTRGSSATGPQSGLIAENLTKRIVPTSRVTFRGILRKRPKPATDTSSSERSVTGGASLILGADDSVSTPSPGLRAADSASVYWPGDLLPSECPNARILTWGYDTVVTKTLSAPSNKNSIPSHAKDLLFALGRERPMDRPIVVVAHSLGGIVVKEVRPSIRMRGWLFTH